MAPTCNQARSAFRPTSMQTSLSRLHRKVQRHATRKEGSPTRRALVHSPPLLDVLGDPLNSHGKYYLGCPTVCDRIARSGPWEYCEYLREDVWQPMHNKRRLAAIGFTAFSLCAMLVGLLAFHTVGRAQADTNIDVC